MERRLRLLRQISSSESTIAGGAGVLVGLGLLHWAIALAGVVAVEAAVAIGVFRYGRELRKAPARALGTGLSCRSTESWGAMVRVRPVSTAFATRFGAGEHLWACSAAGFVGVNRFIAGAALAWAVWAGWQIGTAAGFVAWAVPRAYSAAGGAGVIGAALVGLVLPGLLLEVVTRGGRRRLRAAIGRVRHREYWPVWVQYAPLSPLVARLGLRHGLMTFTCCNPGIVGGGGIVGESKEAILEGLGAAPEVLPGELIAPDVDPGARTRALLGAMSRRAELGGFPIILKPDAGQRGFAVRVVRGETDATKYFREVRSPVLAQRYHAGPRECGILWARCSRPDGSGLAGRIFSVTRKEFPLLVGDGRRTLEDLVHDHPRFHRQAAVFLERFAEQRSRVLAPGETLRLAESGNHCQGTLFRDGADLITPALERAIDALARDFTGGLDIGRFDIRYESDEALRRGEGFAVVELNGTLSESTNIYDPERSIFWAYSVLAGHWTLLYELGAARRREGARPVSVLEIWRELRRHLRERSGSAVAD